MATEQGLGSRYSFIKLLELNGADGSTITMAKNLTETQDMLQDSMIRQANDVMSHTDLRQSSLPTPQIVKIGAGWQTSVVQWDAFKDDISLFKDTMQIPQDAIRYAGDKGAKMAQIEAGHMEGFSQGVANHMVYGTSAADPEKFDGFDVRYKTPDDNSSGNDTWDPAAGADYGVLDMGGTGSDTTSIWLIQWAEDKCTLRTPKFDPQMGLKRTFMNLQKTITDSGPPELHRWDYFTEFEWALGLSIKDLRAVARVRNIESAIANISTDLPKKVIEAREYFNGNEQIFMYTNRKLRTHFKILAENKQNVLYSKENVYQIPLLMFDDMLIRRCDAITNAETAVAAV